MKRVFSTRALTCAGLALAGMLVAAGTQAAPQKGPPEWTIWVAKCWRGQPAPPDMLGQCAMTLVGIFMTRYDCINNNGGRPERKSIDKDGIEIVYSCQPLLRI